MARGTNGTNGTNGSTHGSVGDAGTLPEGAVVLTSLNVSEAEVKLIARALEVSKGNRSRAADLLGMNVRTLRNKLKSAQSDEDGEDP